MPLFGYLLLYGFAIFSASLLGGVLPSLVKLTHRRIQVLVSFVAGLMLGVGLLHLIPHAVEHLHSLDRAMLWALFGILVMFVLMRAFHSHQHGVEGTLTPTDDSASCDQAAEPSHSHSHAEHHDCNHAAGVSWIGITIGLALHTLMDGIALGAAVTADLATAHGAGIAGLGTFLAVALHKPLDSLSITTLMTSQGRSAKAKRLVNIGYALTCPLGAMLFVFGANRFGNDFDATVGAALAFAGGIFICIALADLLPEIEFHSHDRLRLTGALLFGTVLAYAVGFIEPAHQHGHGEAGSRAHDHLDSHDHGHSHDHSHSHDGHSHDHSHGGHEHSHSGSRSPVTVSPD